MWRANRRAAPNWTTCALDLRAYDVLVFPSEHGRFRQTREGYRMLRRLLVFPFVVFLCVGASHAGATVQCTPDDASSKNAEKCAKQYGSAVRKCLKKGIPLDVCDTSTSDKSCGLLSTACTIPSEVDALVESIYDLSAHVSNVAGCSVSELASDEVATCTAKYSAAIRSCLKKRVPARRVRYVEGW